jgi:hypothetical protein
MRAKTALDSRKDTREVTDLLGSAGWHRGTNSPNTFAANCRELQASGLCSPEEEIYATGYATIYFMIQSLAESASSASR